MNAASRVRLKPHYALGLGALLLCGGVTQAGPHVHGAAELMLAAEGNKIEIILNVPAMSVVGFESQVVSAAQQQAVSDADALLRNPDQLFSLRGGQCVLEDTQVDFSAITDVALDAEEDHHTDDEHADHESDDQNHEGDDHDHDHIAKKAGPNGGRLLTNVEPYAEFFAKPDRSV